MKSKESSRLLDLNCNPPTSAADILALKRARRHDTQDLKTYLEFLAGFPEPATLSLRDRKGPAGTKPFEL